MEIAERGCAEGMILADSLTVAPGRAGRLAPANLVAQPQADDAGGPFSFFGSHRLQFREPAGC